MMGGLHYTEFRRGIFDCVHSMSHPGIRATQRMVISQFVWQNINSNAYIASVRRSIGTPPHLWPRLLHRAHALIRCTWTYWPTTTLQWLCLPVDLCGPLYMMAQGQERSKDSSTSVHGDMDSAIWCTIHHYHRSGTSIHITPVGSTQSASGNDTHSHHHKPPHCKWVSGTQLKASLKASPHPDYWTSMFPMALLGIGTSLKDDIKCMAVELIYGTTLRLPGEFFIHSAHSNMDPTIAMSPSSGAPCKLSAASPPGTARGHSDSLLQYSSHVFVQRDAV
jgi:hypothetical protein